MVSVGIGLDHEAQSLPLAGIAIGKFDREVDQSSGSGGILLLLGMFKISLLGMFKIGGSMATNERSHISGTYVRPVCSSKRATPAIQAITGLS